TGTLYCVIAWSILQWGPPRGLNAVSPPASISKTSSQESMDRLSTDDHWWLRRAAGPLAARMESAMACRHAGARHCRLIDADRAGIKRRSFPRARHLGRRQPSGEFRRGRHAGARNAKAAGANRCDLRRVRRHTAGGVLWTQRRQGRRLYGTGGSGSLGLRFSEQLDSPVVSAAERLSLLVLRLHPLRYYGAGLQQPALPRSHVR